VGVRVKLGELPVSLSGDPEHLPQHAPAVFIHDVQPGGPAQPGPELTLHRTERERADEVQDHDGDGEQQQAGAHRHADRGRFPNRRRRSKPVHRTAPSDNDPRAQKADARHDLGPNTRGVQHNGAGGQGVAEAVLTDQHDQRRRCANDGLGPQSRALALDGSFQADECRQPERSEKFDHVSGALHMATQQRAGQRNLHVR
jgi:hypothetical protein